MKSELKLVEERNLIVNVENYNEMVRGKVSNRSTSKERLQQRETEKIVGRKFRIIAQSVRKNGSKLWFVFVGVNGRRGKCDELDFSFSCCWIECFQTC